MSPLLGALAIAGIFIVLAGLASLLMLRWRARRELDLDVLYPAPQRTAVDIGVAMAARASLDTSGHAIDNPSAMSFERKRREANACREEAPPLWSEPCDNNRDRTGWAGLPEGDR